MADDYLGRKMEEYRARQAAGPRPQRPAATLRRLLLRNRSYRGCDPHFLVRRDQLLRIIEVNTLLPSAMNRQVLRFRPVLADEAPLILPHIRLGGALPEVNARLEALGSSKRYRNLLGYTFGTGFGIGMVIDNRLNRGDNSCVETFCLRHKKMPDIIVEDGVAVRAIKRVYGELTGNPDHGLEPKDICEIADGTREGDAEAAKKAFAELGEVAGDAMATAVTLVDGLIVIGGGITAARRYIMPSLLRELRAKIHQLNGNELNRVQMKVYDLDNDEEFAAFAKGDLRTLKVYGTDRYAAYDPQKRVGVMISKLGASKAISVGAYAFALSQLDQEAGKEQ